MDELEKRRRQLADPDNHLENFSDTPIEDLSPESLARIKAEREFESRLNRAMQVEVPDTMPENILLAQRLKKRNGRVVSLALAASVMVFSVFGLIRYERLQHPLFEQALAHVYGELDHLQDSEQLSRQQVLSRLAKMNIALPDLPEKVTFANPCGFAGETAMHLIAEVNGKPVTLLITDVPVTDKMRFGDEHFVGQMREFGLNNLIAIAEDLSLVETLFKQIGDV